MITSQQLIAIDPRASRANAAVPTALSNALKEFGCSDKRVIASLIGMCIGESKGFTTFAEDMYYTTPDVLRRVFPSFFAGSNPKARAEDYLRQPEKLGNFVYANRFGNGGVETGDGYRYRGKGAIHLTFKAGFQEFFKAVGMPLNSDPDYLLTPEGAMRSACWYFKRYKCDVAALKSFKAVYLICQPSGYGYDLHEPYYLKAMEVLL